jgi:hypothetical protein
MRMFKRRTRDDSQPAPTTTTTTDARDGYAPTSAPDAPGGPRWHHGPTRALVTLLAAGVAGLLAYLAAKIGDNSNGGYWAIFGILAGAGLVMALSQVLRRRTTFSPTVFLVAFVPTLIAVGWIFLFHQPHSGLGRGHVMNWSGDLGIDGFVNDMGGNLLPMLAFGLGLVFGFCFDTTGARQPLPPARGPVRQRTAVDTDADQPITRERETVRT